MANDPGKLAMARGIISGLDAADLETWGYPVDTLFDALDEARGANGTEVPKEKLNAYRIQRRILLNLRKNIHHENSLGKAVKAVRYYC
ncbi:MAG: hypothetical protein AB8G99_08965, partial [Planctomycetaceae bacterium]